MHPKNLITLVVNVSSDENSADPDQTALIEQSDLGLQCLSKRLLKDFSNRQKRRLSL